MGGMDMNQLMRGMGGGAGGSDMDMLRQMEQQMRRK